MERKSKALPGELQALRHELQSSFQEGRWERMSGTLGTVAVIAETHGRPELSLRAQSLRELMGDRGGGRGEPGPRLEALFQDLMFHLSHLQWCSQSANA